MSDDKLQEILLGISNKLNNSRVLNGGFDRLEVMVEHIKDKQDETAEQVKKIHDGLYKPDEGLYARVKSIETSTKKIEEDYKIHLKSDEENMENIHSDLSNLNEQQKNFEKKSEITVKLKQVAGEDLQELKTVLDSTAKKKATISKIVWIVLATILGAVAKPLVELIFK